MARSKILAGDAQASFAKEYFETVCHSDASNFTFKGVAQYISEKTGLQIKEHSVRRCKEVRDLFRIIHDTEDEEKLYKDVLMFKSLNVNDFLRKNNDIQLLRESLKLRDSYYQNICATTATILKQKEAMACERDSLKQKCKELGVKVEEQERAIAEQNSTIAKQNKLIQKMRKIIDINVNSEIAVELLKDIGLLKGSDDGVPSVLKENAKANLTLSATDSIPAIVKADSEPDSVNKVVQGLFEKI